MSGLSLGPVRHYVISAWLLSLPFAGILGTANLVAAQYRIVAIGPTVFRGLSWVDPLPPLELGTRLAALSAARLRAFGDHTNGWWVGDGVEDPYVGPRGALLTVFLLTASDVKLTGFPVAGWYEGRLAITNDGPFIEDLLLRPSPRYLFGSIPDVAPGQVALWCCHEIPGGFGSFSTLPFVTLDRVEVQLEADPVLEVTAHPSSGRVSWSALPEGGRVEVLTSATLAGPWEVEVVTASESRTAMILPPGSGATRFVRLRWQHMGTE